MKRIELTSEWLSNWTPTRTTEIADRGCKGLLVRGGPTGLRTFYRWADVRDDATGPVRRRRVKLGHFPALSLGSARKAVHEAREARRAEAAGSVKEIAEAYRRDVLSHRERADEAWNIVRVHVVEAQPDPKRPPFGEWIASAVRPPDVATVVRHAKEPRTVEADGRTRRLGGPGVARVVLRELRALFAHAVETGVLEMTPAGVMRARAFGLRATSRSRILDAKEVKALFAALDLTALLEGTAKPRRLSPTVRLALAFQLYVPLRSQSIIGARWDELDLDGARWTVPVERLKLHADERATARPFEVPLPATAVAILRKLREEAGSSPWVLASPKPAKLGKEPQHVEEKALVRALSRLQAAGEKGTARLAFGARLTVHDLRRTWRSFAMDLGVDHVVAERSLGHVAALRAAGFSGAADVYGRAQMVEQRAAAAELVAAAFDRIRLGKTAQVVPMRERVTGV
jgi:integrase